LGPQAIDDSGGVFAVGLLESASFVNGDRQGVKELGGTG
jgi:hypothetical protein